MNNSTIFSFLFCGRWVNILSGPLFNNKLMNYEHSFPCYENGKLMLDLICPQAFRVTKFYLIFLEGEENEINYIPFFLLILITYEYSNPFLVIKFRIIYFYKKKYNCIFYFFCFEIIDAVDDLYLQMQK